MARLFVACLAVAHEVDHAARANRARHNRPRERRVRRYLDLGYESSHVDVERRLERGDERLLVAVDAQLAPALRVA